MEEKGLRGGLEAYALEVERQTQELKTNLRQGYKQVRFTAKFIDSIINDSELEEQLKSKILKEAEVELMQIELTLDKIRDKIPKWEAEAKRLNGMIDQGGG